MGGVMGLAVLLIAAWVLIAPHDASLVAVALVGLERWVARIDWPSALTGFAAGAIIVRIAAVRWREVPQRLVAPLASNGRGVRALGWLGLLLGVLLLY
jgi:hypothetical protein